VITKPHIVGLKSFLLFSFLVLLFNLLVCVCWFKILLWQIIGMQCFLVALFAVLLTGTKSLLHRFPANKIGILLGSISVKMFVALVYIILVISNSAGNEITIVLFFVSNYYVYLAYSVFRMVSWNKN
jgi:hypothetical protein